MKAPPRLIHDPSVAPELRADLERTAASEHRYDVAAGLATFSAAIGSAGGLPPADAAGAGGQAAQGAAAAKGSLLGATGLKVTLAAAGTAALVAVSIVALPRHTPRATPPRAPAVASQPLAAPAIAAQPAPAPSAAQLTAVPAAPADAKPSLEARGAGRTPDADRALRREIALVGEMKAALENDPARAYQLSQEANREFGRGMLYEEREALATLALSSLGRDEQAAQRARAFLARYPKSSLRERLEPIAQGQ